MDNAPCRSTSGDSALSGPQALRPPVREPGRDPRGRERALGRGHVVHPRVQGRQVRGALVQQPLPAPRGQTGQHVWQGLPLLGRVPRRIPGPARLRRLLSVADRLQGHPQEPLAVGHQGRAVLARRLAATGQLHRRAQRSLRLRQAG